VIEITIGKTIYNAAIASEIHTYQIKKRRITPPQPVTHIFQTAYG
jgi:hypothetical protein